MDTKDLLLLYEGNIPFLLRPLKSLLEENQWVVDEMKMKEISFTNMKRIPDLIVAQAEDLLANSSAMVYMADQCIEHGYKVALIGEPEQLRDVVSQLSPTIIAEAFQRPIDVKSVCQRLEEVLKDLKESSNRKNILVVDDTPTFLRTMMEWLNDDYNVAVAPAATAAFTAINSKRPDLILLDYEMPICSGAQFLEMLHADPGTKDIPVIFLTSRGDKETVKEVLALKPQGYLLKNQPKMKILDAIKAFFIKEAMNG